ncbi:MAG TPA: metalloregulator ArsR/SmtB family transcription factor [Candidatus Saccharimonadales bacterium]
MTTAVQKASLSAIFNALGDGTRYKIVSLLLKDSTLCVSEVAARVGISTAGVSQHMKILEKVGLVKPLRNGQKICYQVGEARGHARAVFNLMGEE